MMNRNIWINIYLKLMYSKPIREVKEDFYSMKSEYDEDSLDAIWERIIELWEQGVKEFDSSTLLNKKGQVVCKVLNGKVINQYSSLSDASRSIGVDKSYMSRCIKNNKELKGYYWRFG